MKRNIRKFSTYALAFTMLVAFLLVMSSAPVFGQAEDNASGVPVNGALADNGPAPKAGGVDRLLADTGGKAQVSVSSATGVANFIRFPEGARLSMTRGGSAEAEAAAFFAQYGDAFGIADAGSQLALAGRRVDDLGMTHLTYQQVYNGVNVFAGRMDVHVNKAGRITAVNGVFVPKVALKSTPDLSAAEAANIAINTVLSQDGATAQILTSDAARGSFTTDLSAVNSKLYVYHAGLLQGVPGRAHLVYDVEVANPALTVREFVFVDAHTGQIVNQIAGIEGALSINVYNGGYGPGFLVWQSGDPYPYAGPNAVDINNLIDGT
ncbi:MAG: hypothetical protein GY796_29740, partial [Chloroflexi bacterium]|nr:hypothetical protein [Chloroflexota bacterium]